MRILIYNWVVFDQDRRGGGVTVYTRNLVETLLKAGNDVAFLCSGSYYDEIDKSLRYELINTLYDGQCRVYSIINSPVFAPAYIEFFHLETMFNDRKMKGILSDFFQNEGPFDVVHFQNLEGLSLDAFSVRNTLLNTNFILSLHNYQAFCPRVDLWRNDSVCDMKSTNEECLMCMECHPPSSKLIKKMSMTYDLKRNYSYQKENEYLERALLIDQEYREIENKPITDQDKIRLNKSLSKYRSSTVNMINANFDSVLAVSKRVEDIAVSMGIDRNIIMTSYIGTKIAEHTKNFYLRKNKDFVTLVYLGYRRKEKGFYFFIDALNMLSREDRNKIRIIIAARGDMSTDELIAHKEDFYGFKSLNGYERNELEEILAMADFGVVPVLWEDNLPQIAIEMASKGVPYICTDRGGARELTRSSKFVLSTDKVTEFSNKISYFANCPEELGDFYDGYAGLTTMAQNLEQLLRVYNKRHARRER